MKRSSALIVLFVLQVLNLCAARTDTLDRQSRFESVKAFTSALADFKPDQSRNWLAYQFGAMELGQPEDEHTGGITLPSSVDFCSVIWSSDDCAVVFATAKPPIVATHACTGVLFLLGHLDNKWRIVDCKSFTATGQYAGVTCALTSHGGTDVLTPANVIVTVTKTEGGRGVSDEISASYRILGGLLRVDLN